MLISLASFSVFGEVVCLKSSAPRRDRRLLPRSPLALLKIPSVGRVARSDSGREAPRWVGFTFPKPP